MIHQEILSALKAVANPEKIPDYMRFFKTGPGQYGEGDIFWGIKVPLQRKIAQRFRGTATLDDVSMLLDSPVHECRLTGLHILRDLYETKGGELEAPALELYEDNFHRINNWDLVDSSAPFITGPWYFTRNRDILSHWADTPHLWTQRIAVLTTFYFIRRGDPSTTFDLADRLLLHPHDLMHKAIGWMLREAGNRNIKILEDYLLKPREGRPLYLQMPRTMLRYTIEKFPPLRYKAYLEGRAGV